MEDKEFLKRRKGISIFLLVCMSMLTTAAPSHAGWLIYHKPAFKGKVIDAETKEPIEGAVVVVEYLKHSIRISPDLVTLTVDVRETLTDKDGSFYIPSLTAIIDPLSSEDVATFIIYKPGYGNFPDHRVTPPLGFNISLDELELFFGEDFYDKDMVFWLNTDKDTLKRFVFTAGLVELPRLKTREERIASLPSIPGPEIPSKKMKNLIRLSNEERISLGLEPEVFP